MNREEYMSRLRNRLRRLPKEDYDRAVNYFEEYFEEAGAENEAQAIEDLGTPESAAEQIIRDFAVENAKEPAKDAKKGFSAVWIGLLAIFAIPVGLPLALAFGAVGIAVALVIVLLVFCVFAMAVSVAVASIPCIVVSVVLLFTSFADGVATLGIGLTGLGVGILLVMGSIELGKWLLHAITRMFGKIAGKHSGKSVHYEEERHYEK